jgi:oxygen-independent coproporphyrinogen-3 oxidase
MIGTGVASFSHLNGTHFQNLTDWNGYLEALQTGILPLNRAFKISHQEKMTREMILQLKLGQIEIDYFRQKFGIEILDHFSVPYQKLRGEGMLDFDMEKVSLTQKGLLQVDRLLPEFYAEKYQNARYT